MNRQPTTSVQCHPPSLSLPFQLHTADKRCKRADQLHLFPCVFVFSERSVQRVRSWLWSIPVSEQEGRTALVSGRTPGLLEPLIWINSHCTLCIYILILSWLSFPEVDSLDKWQLFGRIEPETFWGYGNISVTTKPPKSFPELHTVNPTVGNWNIHFRGEIVIFCKPLFIEGRCSWYKHHHLSTHSSYSPLSPLSFIANSFLITKPQSEHGQDTFIVEPFILTSLCSLLHGHFYEDL